MQKKTDRDIVNTLSVVLENPDAKLPATEQARMERLRAIHSRWMGQPTRLALIKKFSEILVITLTSMSLNMCRM